jgi:hypothetical protein
MRGSWFVSVEKGRLAFELIGNGGVRLSQWHVGPAPLAEMIRRMRHQATGLMPNGIAEGQQAEQAVVFAGTAYGALCWSCKGSLKDANAALKSASEHMKRVSREAYPDIFDEHAWLRHVVTTHTAAERPTMSR